MYPRRTELPKRSLAVIVNVGRTFGCVMRWLNVRPSPDTSQPDAIVRPGVTTTVFGIPGSPANTQTHMQTRKHTSMCMQHTEAIKLGCERVLDRLSRIILGEICACMQHVCTHVHPWVGTHIARTTRFTVIVVDELHLDIRASFAPQCDYKRCTAHWHRLSIPVDNW